MTRWRQIRRYFDSFALAFRRSAQYFVILRDTSDLAAADILLTRFVALATAALT